MLTRIVDEDTNDWVFGRGRQGYLHESQAVKQIVKTKLQSFINNCFFDMGEGIDWFFHLSGKDISGLQIAITSKIASIYGVTKVELVELEDSNRIASVKYKLTSIWDTNISGNVNV